MKRITPFGTTLRRLRRTKATSKKSPCSWARTSKKFPEPLHPPGTSTWCEKAPATPVWAGWAVSECTARRLRKPGGASVRPCSSETPTWPTPGRSNRSARSVRICLRRLTCWPTSFTTPSNPTTWDDCNSVHGFQKIRLRKKKNSASDSVRAVQMPSSPLWSKKSESDSRNASAISNWSTTNPMFWRSSTS